MWERCRTYKVHSSWLLLVQFLLNDESHDLDLQKDHLQESKTYGRRKLTPSHSERYYNTGVWLHWGISKLDALLGESSAVLHVGFARRFAVILCVALLWNPIGWVIRYCMSGQKRSQNSLAVSALIVERLVRFYFDTWGRCLVHTSFLVGYGYWYSHQVQEAVKCWLSVHLIGKNQQSCG